MLGPIKFLDGKNSRSKKFLGPKKIMGLKNCWVRKKFKLTREPKSRVLYDHQYICSNEDE